jgi:hypothetical protein
MGLATKARHPFEDQRFTKVACAMRIVGWKLPNNPLNRMSRRAKQATALPTNSCGLRAYPLIYIDHKHDNVVLAGSRAKTICGK